MGRCLPQGPAARPRCPCVLRGGRTRRQELHRTRAHPPPLPDPKTLPRSTPTTLLARPPQQPPPPPRAGSPQPHPAHTPALPWACHPAASGGGGAGKMQGSVGPGAPSPFPTSPHLTHLLPCTEGPCSRCSSPPEGAPHLPVLSASQPGGTKAGGSRRFMKHRCRGPAPTAFNCLAPQVMIIRAGSGLLSCCPGVPLRHHVLPAPTQAGARASFPRCSAQL